MQVSKRFLRLVQNQLDQFSDREDLQSLVVYLTEPGDGASPTLVPVGQWPRSGRALPPVRADSPLRIPAEQRRWLALRHRGMLLGAIQVETRALPWPANLNQRLQATVLCLTEALCLDLERQQLDHALQRQQEQLRVLVHQLRNPLAALRTFGQLLLRRLEPSDRNRELVESLLHEEQQVQRYVSALQQLEGSEPMRSLAGETPLLLPPSLNGPDGQPLAQLLSPLLQRAAASASLQGRHWQGPESLPAWCGDSGAVAEILANLLENAFAYSAAGAAVGLACLPHGRDGWQLCVWDGGTPIPPEERTRIFERGQRGSAGASKPGTGLGLALARDLAESLGGSLELVVPPSAVLGQAHDLLPGPQQLRLPAEGNAFCLRLPPKPPRP
jgi:signal transduction histidine kinase